MANNLWATEIDNLDLESLRNADVLSSEDLGARIFLEETNTQDQLIPPEISTKYKASFTDERPTYGGNSFSALHNVSFPDSKPLIFWIRLF